MEMPTTTRIIGHKVLAVCQLKLMTCSDDNNAMTPIKRTIMPKYKFLLFMMQKFYECFFEEKGMISTKPRTMSTTGQ